MKQVKDCKVDISIKLNIKKRKKIYFYFRLGKMSQQQNKTVIEA